VKYAYYDMICSVHRWTKDSPFHPSIDHPANKIYLTPGMRFILSLALEVTVVRKIVSMGSAGSQNMASECD
jgi:hypothetical protein